MTPTLDDGGPSGLDTGPRSKILTAGRQLIMTKGSGFTTQDVIQEAGVALQTFYRYFGSKDQLLLALIGLLIKEHCDVLAESAERFDVKVVVTADERDQTWHLFAGNVAGQDLMHSFEMGFGK